MKKKFLWATSLIAPIVPLATVIACDTKTLIIEVAGPDMLIVPETSIDAMAFRFHGMLKKEVLDGNITRVFKNDHYFGNGVKYSFFVLEDSKSQDDKTKQFAHRYQVPLPLADQKTICASEESVKKFIVDSVINNSKNDPNAEYFANWFEWIKDAYK